VALKADSKCRLIRNITDLVGKQATILATILLNLVPLGTSYLIQTEEKQRIRHFFDDIYFTLFNSFPFVYLQFKACFFLFAP
jgi:hypothetical protein